MWWENIWWKLFVYSCCHTHKQAGHTACAGTPATEQGRCLQIKVFWRKYFHLRLPSKLCCWMIASAMHCNLGHDLIAIFCHLLSTSLDHLKVCRVQFQLLSGPWRKSIVWSIWTGDIMKFITWNKVIWAPSLRMTSSNDKNSKNIDRNYNLF